MFNFVDDIKQICSSLHSLNITYFCHVFIDKDKKFTAIANNPAFVEHYLKNKYYNADIHMAEEDKLQKFILWDALSKTWETEQMDAEAAAFGVRHTFTIIEKDEAGYHFYHFSTNIQSNIMICSRNSGLLSLCSKSHHLIHFRRLVA